MTEKAQAIRLVVGLGNPGDRYLQTRHNAGFWFVDELARRFGGSFRSEAKFFGDVSRIQLDGYECHLLKPMTFMNKSGESVGALAHFFKIPVDQILVAHDEIDLPPGGLKLKEGGGHGGHNGLRDCFRVLGDQGFWRLRIGVGHPGSKDQVVSYVLNRAGTDEQIEIERAIEKSADEFPRIIAGDWAKAFQALHTRQ